MKNKVLPRIKRRETWYLIITMAAVTLLSGCKPGRYSVVVVNNTNQPIRQLTMWYDQMPFEYGDVESNSKETGIFEQHRMTEVIKLTWVNADNSLQSQEFKTFDFVPKRYDDGRVTLNYLPDNTFTMSYSDQGL